MVLQWSYFRSQHTQCNQDFSVSTFKKKFCILRIPKLLSCLFSGTYSISSKVKDWPLLQEQISETACLSNGFSVFIKTIYFPWTLQDKHQSQEECTMKFIITLQTQILGSFYFAQVKKIFLFFSLFFFFFLKETKVVMAGDGGVHPHGKEKAQLVYSKRPLQGCHKAQLNSGSPRPRTFSANGQGSV